MLTRELLKANTELNGLTDEQITAIETLSKNDENSVIGARIGEVYRQMDTTIANATGIARNGDEKTYLYLERAAKALGEKVKTNDDLAKQVADLTKEKTRLEKVIADGESDTETKKALAQAQKDLTSITKQFTDLKVEFDNQKAEHEKEILGIRINNELDVATNGIKFKKDLPDAVTRVLLTNAKDKIRSMNPEFIDGGDGNKVLAFKGDDGAILRNQQNHLQPFTAAELIANELKTMGVLDEGRNVPGGGTNTPTGNNGPMGSMDIAGAKTRTEAYDLIANSLMAQGLTNGSEAFDKAMQQAWQDNNISALPER